MIVLIKAFLLLVSAEAVRASTLSLSKSVISTTVPLASPYAVSWTVSARYWISSWCTLSIGIHLPVSQIFSRSQLRMLVTPSFLETTVRRFPIENDAVFRPRPNLPRSLGLLFFSGPSPPQRIALNISSRVIPPPSSTILTHPVRSPTLGVTSTLTFLAPAVMLLSTKSAKAVWGWYPIFRMDSISAEGCGTSSFTLFWTLQVTCSHEWRHISSPCVWLYTICSQCWLLWLA